MLACNSDLHAWDTWLSLTLPSPTQTSCWDDGGTPHALLMNSKAFFWLVFFFGALEICAVLNFRHLADVWGMQCLSGRQACVCILLCLSLHQSSGSKIPKINVAETKWCLFFLCTMMLIYLQFASSYLWRNIFISLIVGDRTASLTL